MFILEESQVFLDDEYFVECDICFVGIKSKYFQGQHLKHITRFWKFL